MKKTMCVILGLAFLALGILGITGLVPMFKSISVYVNIAEIALGGLSFLVGVYARQDGGYSAQKIKSAQQGNDIDRQRHEIDQQRKEFEQQKSATIENQIKSNKQ